MRTIEPLAEIKRQGDITTSPDHPRSVLPTNEERTRNPETIYHVVGSAFKSHSSFQQLLSRTSQALVARLRRILTLV